MNKELLTIPDFCKTTNLGRTHVYRLLKRGEIAALKIGRRTFIRPQEVERWLLTQPTYKPATLPENV